MKYFKNRDRETPEVKEAYIPQYKSAGLQPQIIKSSVVPVGTKPAVQPQTPPQSKKIPLTNYNASQYDFLKTRQEYPNISEPPDPNAKTYAVFDGLVVDDIEDEVVYDEPSDNTNNNFHNEPLNNNSNNSDSEEIFQALFDLEEESYLLLVNGALICSGPMKEIEEEVNSIVFGEHDLYSEQQTVSPESIMILKKIKVKYGAYFV